MRNRRAMKFVVAAAGVSLVLGMSGAAIASAAPAETWTDHTKVQQNYDTAIDPITNSGCPAWFVNAPVYLDFTGNGHAHGTINGAGDGWFNYVFTGTGSITFYDGTPIFDSDDNVIGINGTPNERVDGKLSLIFGYADNRQNANQRGNVTVQGTVASTGASITMHFRAHAIWSKGADTNGPPDHMDFSNTDCH